MDSLGSRIKWLRDDKNLDLIDVFRGSKIPIATLSRLENNQGKTFVHTVMAVANFFHASLEWLLRSKGYPYLINDFPNNSIFTPDLLTDLNQLPADLQKSIIHYINFLIHENSEIYKHPVLDRAAECQQTYLTTNKPTPDSVYIPVIGSAAAGNPIWTEEFIDGFVPISKDLINGNNYFVRIKGDSMIDSGLQDGDLVLIRKQPMVESGEIALVKYDNEITIKHFYHENNHIRLKSSNPEYEDIIIKDIFLVKVAGKVIKVIPKEEADQSMQFIENNQQ